MPTTDDCICICAQWMPGSLSSHSRPRCSPVTRQGSHRCWDAKLTSMARIRKFSQPVRVSIRMQASIIGKPVRPVAQASNLSWAAWSSSCGRRASITLLSARNSMSGSLSSRCMKWQCQCSRLSKLRSERVQRGSASRFPITAARRRRVACTTVLRLTVPIIRWTLRREQLASALSGLLISRM